MPIAAVKDADDQCPIYIEILGMQATIFISIASLTSSSCPVVCMRACNLDSRQTRKFDGANVYHCASEECVHLVTSYIFIQQHEETRFRGRSFKQRIESLFGTSHDLLLSSLTIRKFVPACSRKSRKKVSLTSDTVG
jgi:hypothetical protein